MHTHILITYETHTQSYHQFHQQYSQLTTSAYSFLAPLTYDSVWTLALALHQVDTSSRGNFDADIVPDKCGVNMNGDVNLGVFNFSNSYLGCRIKQELLATEFVGVSVRNSKGGYEMCSVFSYQQGVVKFNEDGARHISDITLLQYRRTCVCDFCVLI